MGTLHVGYLPYPALDHQALRSRHMTDGWRTIDSAPTNERVLIQANNRATDECAVGWFDLISQRWFYAPQGGHVTWHPTHWMPLPSPPQQEA